MYARRAALYSAVQAVVPVFQRDFAADPRLQSSDNYDRDTAATVRDFEGLIKTCKIGEARQHGMRRVENLLAGPTDTLVTEIVTVESGHEYRLGFEGDGSITLSGAATGTLAGTAGQRKAFDVFTATSTSLTVTVTGTITDALLEDVSGQANPNPSSYVSAGVLSAPWHGANVDGVQYFNTTNGNTVDGSNVVTENPGNPVVGVIGLLMEPEASNLIPDSDQIDAASWVKDNVTVNANVTAGPSGAPTGDLVLETATSSFHRVNSQDIPVSNGVQYILSAYVKKHNNRRYGYIRTNIAGTNYNTGFDLDTGSLTYEPPGHVGTIEAVGDYYRVTVTVTAGLENTYMAVSLSDSPVTNNNIVSYLGDVNEGIYVAGCQFEESAKVSSLIVTSGGPVTRSADTLYTPFSTPHAQGMVVTEYVPLADNFPFSGESGLAAFTISFASGPQRIAVNDRYYINSTTTNRFVVEPFIDGNRYVVGSRWSGAAMNIGVKDVDGDGLWNWATEQAYDGAFNSNDVVSIGAVIKFPKVFQTVQVYDSDQGEGWIESNF